MPITSPEGRGVLVLLFVAAQCLSIHMLVSRERAPQPPTSAQFPTAFGQWTFFREDPVDAAIAKELSADSLVSQTYTEARTSSFVSLLVAWFQTQREGARQPHSPKVCLPGAGWTPRVSDEITFNTASGAITVNRYIVDRGARRAVVLYWYQTPRRVVASEWASKFWVAADALRDKRTDTALVRVIAWPTSGGDQAATALASAFGRDLYPRLREYLPH